MTTREDLARLLLKLAKPSESFAPPDVIARNIAALLIPEESKPTLRVTPCCVCGSLEQAWYITKGPDDPGKVYCATCPQGGMPLYPPAKPKPEPAKADWLDSYEFESLTTDYADAYLKVAQGTGGPIPANIRRTRIVPAIRANYIGEREKRYRAALEAIVSRGSVSARTIDVAREALKDKP